MWQYGHPDKLTTYCLRHETLRITLMKLIPHMSINLLDHCWTLLQKQKFNVDGLKAVFCLRHHSSYSKLFYIFQNYGKMNVGFKNISERIYNNCPKVFVFLSSLDKFSFFFFVFKLGCGKF